MHSVPNTAFKALGGLQLLLKMKYRMKMHDDSVSVHPVRGQFQREELKIFFLINFFGFVLFTNNTQKLIVKMNPLYVRKKTRVVFLNTKCTHLKLALSKMIA